MSSGSHILNLDSKHLALAPIGFDNMLPQLTGLQEDIREEPGLKVDS